MSGEVYGYLRDVGGYLTMVVRKRFRKLPGMGVDYSRSEYLGTVRRAVERIHPRRMRLDVTEIVRETPSTVTLKLRREDGSLPPFRPGQYVNLFVSIDGVQTSRPYSISSPPGLDHLDLTIKEMEGGFVSRYLTREIEAGDMLESSGPSGSFYHEPLIDGQDLVFLAGGSGISRFMRIFGVLVEGGCELRVQVLF